MRKGLLFVALCAILFSLVVSPALASPGLTVGHAGGKGLSPEVSPGERYIQTLLASIGKDDAATDVLIEVLGYGETLEGGITPLSAEEDKSSYSARTFIKPDRIILHLEPGETKKADVTVTIPADVGDGGRYAILRFSTAPTGKGMVGIISAIVLPMKFTIKDSQLIHTGKITEVATSEAVSGKPVDIFTIFQNTGNHHFKIEEQTEIRDAGGKLIDTVYITSSSPIPEGTRRIKTTFIPQGELAVGVYSVKAKVVLEDGTVLDEAEGSFEVKERYVPPPSSPAPPEQTTTAPPPSTPAPATPAAINWTAIGGSVAAAIIVGLLIVIFLLLRRRRA